MIFSFGFEVSAYLKLTFNSVDKKLLKDLC